MSYHSESPFLIPPTRFFDEYNLDMAIIDFLEGDIEQEVVAQITFRDLMNSGVQYSDPSKPKKIPFYISAGLEPLMQSLSRWGFTQWQLARYAAKIIPGTNDPYFPPELIRYFADPEKQRLRVSIEAREEGRLAFPHEPLLIIRGPKWQVDMMEVAANNLIKNHTKGATIAAEFWLAAESPSGRRPLLIDGSPRRSSEWGGLGVARSAHIAGWAGSSNDFAEEVFGIPAMGGGQAHSFYMAAADEATANRRWMRHRPPVSLPDTHNILEGMETHLRICEEMGLHPAKVKQDSDDPKWFIDTYSRKMREHGFDPSKVWFTASDSLNVMRIYDLTHIQDLPYSAFIVGTHLGNHVQDPIEAPVQKLAEITGLVGAERIHEAREVIKVAKDKASFPGVQQVLHMYEERPGVADLFRGSVIAPRDMWVGENGRLGREIISMPHPRGDTPPEEGAKSFAAGIRYLSPNIPVMENGQPLLREHIEQDSVGATQAAREQFFASMASLHPQHKRIIDPIPIGYGVEQNLFNHQRQEILNERLKTQRQKQKLQPA